MNLKIDATTSFMVTAFTPLHIQGEECDYTELTISGILLSQVKKAFLQTKEGDIPLVFNFINDNQITISLSELKKSPNNSAFFVLLLDDKDGWFPVGPIIRTLYAGNKDEPEDTDTDISV
jgi:hypothetical protein